MQSFANKNYKFHCDTKYWHYQYWISHWMSQKLNFYFKCNLKFKLNFKLKNDWQAIVMDIAYNWGLQATCVWIIVMNWLLLGLRISELGLKLKSGQSLNIFEQKFPNIISQAISKFRIFFPRSQDDCRFPKILGNFPSRGNAGYSSFSWRQINDVTSSDSVLKYLWNAE